MATLFATTWQTRAQRLFLENFEELKLGPNVEESLGGAQVWTKSAPSGWTIDDSKMPGFGDPALDGVTEWFGWSFASKNWWARAADDQRRSEFSLGQGTVLIADPDEWANGLHPQGFFASSITTKAIDISGALPNSLVLAYDSSWRPEALDDGLPNFPVDAAGNPINDQTGYLTKAFDGAAETEIQRWDSKPDSPNYHDHLPNESVVLPLNNPVGAKSLVLKFGMENAANDWWWALDNIAVGVPPFATGIAADGVSFTVRIVEAAGKSVDQGKAVIVEVDGKAVTPVQLSHDGNYLMVRYSQAPAIFPPHSHVTVTVKYTSNDSRALQDTLEFDAPGYTSVTSTPLSLTATVSGTEWLTIDKSKGVQLNLDDTVIAASSITPSDTNLVAQVVLAQPLDSDSAHVLTTSFATTAGSEVSDPVHFTGPVYPSIPTSLATATGTAAQPGMRWRTHQAQAPRATSISAAEQELIGGFGLSVHDTTGQGTDGFFAIEEVNFEQFGNAAGHFNSSASAPDAVADRTVPGIPGVTGSEDYFAGEALTFIEFSQAGVYTMAVNCEDGFQLSTGTTNELSKLILGKWDGSRSAADTSFSFKVAQAGVYLFRLLYFKGSSGGSVEWFTVNPDGSLALVGGAQPGALKAYRLRQVPEPSISNGGISSISISGNTLTINYTGTLKSALNVTGPFQAVAGAAAPYRVTASGAAQFYIAE